MLRLLLILLLLKASLSVAQSVPGERAPIPGDERKLLSLLQQGKEGVNQAELLLDLAAYYVFLPGEWKEDLDQAKHYADNARVLSNFLNYPDGRNEALVLLGTIAHERGNDELAGHILDTAYNLIEKTKQQAHAEHSPIREARALHQIVTLNIARGEYALAENQLHFLLKFYEENKFPNRHYLLDKISLLRQLFGDPNKALYYRLECIRSVEATGDYRSAASFYFDLGFMYRETGQFEKGLEYFKQSFERFKKEQNVFLYELMYSIAEVLTKLKRPQEAVSFLNKYSVEFPPINNRQRAKLELALATSYRVAAAYPLAEEHYKKLVALSKDSEYDHIAAIRSLAQVYIEWGKYREAKPFLDSCIAYGNFSRKALGHLHFMLFKADSAAGNYLSAISHIMKNKELDDEEYTATKTKESQELRIKYETEKKDQEIKLHEQNILLLRSSASLLEKDLAQTRLGFQLDSIKKDQYLDQLNFAAAKKDKDLLLQQQNIKSLEKQDKLKQVSLRQANQIKNMTIAGIGLLLVILILLYNQYRVKLKNSKALGKKNQSLEKLVAEKEWLLKEVHHRVKNNLHTIMSLLETQSAYLKDEALAAIQNSQHRVYAMSLIHQRLYQKENSTIVDMGIYLSELISYLKDSYDTRQRIQFITNIENIRLDISQAIPVGLILNEVVTNSIKYAFPENKSGEVSIDLSLIDNKIVALTIKDNGIGIPSSWEDLQKNSIGLKLIKGLSDDLKAECSIRPEAGTKVVVVFQKEFIAQQTEKTKLENSAL